MCYLCECVSVWLSLIHISGFEFSCFAGSMRFCVVSGTFLVDKFAFSRD